MAMRREEEGVLPSHVWLTITSGGRKHYHI